MIMLMKKFKLVRLLFWIVLLTSFGCNKNDMVEPEMESMALFLAINDYNQPEHNDHGILVVDANSMKVLRQISSDMYFNSLELSSDHKTWYVIRSSYLDNDNFTLQALDSESGNLIKDVEVNNPKMALSRKSDVFVVFGDANTGLQFVDKNTFQIIHEKKTYDIFQGDTLDANVRVAAFSPDDKLFYGWGNRIFEYDINSFSITQEFHIQGETPQNLTLSDISLSPDGRNLFVTTQFSSQGLFFSIELANSSYSYYDAGYDSQMAVSPDGRYVFVTDPAGLPLDYPDFPIPTNIVYRYDVSAKKMERMLEGVDWNGLTNGFLLTSYPQVSPNNKYLFLVLWQRKYTSDGKPVDMVKINIRTKKIVGYLELPGSMRGWMVSDTEIGKYETR